jgi:hypothetical protein
MKSQNVSVKGSDMKTKKNKSKIEVRDLKPRKDAKAGYGIGPFPIGPGPGGRH